MYAGTDVWEDECTDWSNNDGERERKGELSEWAWMDCQELRVCATHDTLHDVKNAQQNKFG
jgi:hypothetical protein